MPLIVWDFDLTITRVHTCGNNLDFTALSLEEVIADPVGFRLVIQSLQQAGYQVAIASYGYKNTILQLTDRIFSGTVNPFNVNNVVTPQDTPTIFGWREGFEPPFGLGKWVLLQLLRDRFGFSETEMVLLDDSIINCSEAEMKGYRCKNIRMFTRHHGFASLLDEVPSQEFPQMWNKFLRSSG